MDVQYTADHEGIAVRERTLVAGASIVIQQGWKQ
jgi:hypothetical protein